MKKFALIAVTAALASSAAFAGGPVIVNDEPEPRVVVAPPSSFNPLWVVAPIIVCALACGGSSSNATPATPVAPAAGQ